MKPRRLLAVVAVVAVVAGVAVVALGACGRRDVVSRAAPEVASRAIPGARLPESAAPLHYDLRLEVDPDSADFHGTVAIRIVVRGADRIWLHASGLAITTATWHHRGDRTERAATIATRSGELQAFDLGEVVTGELELAIAYSGRTDRDQEGLFRQLDRGRWYLYAQSESVFARRFVPCFDEPRFKVPWKVALVVPAGQVALANAAQTSAVAVPDGRRELGFAETAPMPSYLLAIAVGPFTIVDAGTAGQQRIPLRAVVLDGDAKEAGVVAAKTPALVAALEAYFDAPLPWPKLDFVAVPKFFGAMENPGLITFERETLVGAAGTPGFDAHFVKIAAHELAHQWLGNSVTPAWWDDLWLAEAFAQWMSDKLASELGAFDDEALRRGIMRQQALAADDAVDARPLHRAVEHGAEAESEFDTISYDKGAALLATFERFAGADPFRSAVRAYLAAHAGGTAITADFIGALAHATTPALARALAVDIDRAGAPIVELAIRCPHVIATARNGIVPLCLRTPAGEHCELVEERTELALPSCPAWVIGNARGLGYYQVVEPGVPLAERVAGERLSHGEDVAAALARGELTAKRAADELRALAAGDGYAQLGALAIARALAPSAEPAAFAAWIAKLFAKRLVVTRLLEPGDLAERTLRDELLALAPLPAPDPVLVEAALAHPRKLAPPRLTTLIALAAARGGEALFDRVRDLALAETADTHEALIEALGTFGSAVVPHAIAQLDGLPISVASAYFARPATRAAAWSAVRAHLDRLLASAAPLQSKELVEATASLCDATQRAEVSAAFEPHVADLVDGRQVLDRSLATIDRCIARRAAMGDFVP